MSIRSHKKSRDPNFKAESKKYSNPVASREYLLEIIKKAGVPLKRKEIAEKLDIHEPEEREGLRRRLKAMIRDGQLIKNRRGAYVLVNDKDLIRGRIAGHPDGFGFLEPDDGSDSLFLTPRQMRSVLHNDLAVVRVVGLDHRGRREAELVEVIQRSNSEIVGRIFWEGGIGFVVPEDRRISQDILVPNASRREAQDGLIVVVRIDEQPNGIRQPIGTVTEVLGEHMAPGMEVIVAARVYGIPVDWPAPVQKETDRIPEYVQDKDIQGRKDLRDLPLMTIDGEDARDFDDAVYCKKTPKGWRLVVAIADVSHYVKPGSALDEEAQNRGTSVYFPGSVVPMLPEKLSNGLCSLNPHVDRLCTVCDMTVSRQGQVTRSSFYSAVMHSRARLTYTKVAAMLIENDQPLREEYREIVPVLDDLHDVYKAFARARENRGTIDFETVETRIDFDENRKISEIVPVIRNDAHKLIEECMIAANVCAAKFLQKYKMPTLFRVHEGPKEDRLMILYQFLGQLGLGFSYSGDTPAPADYAHLLDEIRERPDYNLIQTVLLRSLSQADYRPQNQGHFGLSLEAYAHFTSPIRRYPDLMVHRAIKHILEGQQKDDFYLQVSAMEKLGRHCSMTERRADEATRDAVMSLKCQFMLDHVGDEFDGMISAVTSFGIFVELKDIYIEGLIHVTELGHDYYHFDPVSQRMNGERMGESFRLGDKIRVQVVAVDVDEKKIDLSRVVVSGKAVPRKKRRRR